MNPPHPPPRYVLVRGELLDGLDIDGNARVIIPYSPLSEAPHGRVRYIDPAAIVGDVDVARPTLDEVEAAKTPAGGWTKAQLAAWGVPWPPPKGWRRGLEMASGATRRPA